MNCKIISIIVVIILISDFRKCLSKNGIIDETPVISIVHSIPISIFKKVNKTCECGRSLSTRIVGGSNASPGEFPWQVAFGWSPASRFCGGTFVTNRHVITAAHCFYRRMLSFKNINVYLGITNFNKLDIGYQTRRVADVKLHPRYCPKYKYHDIAVVTLDKPVNFSKKISPPCFDRRGRNYVNYKLTVIGWGRLAFGGPASPILQKVEVPVRHHKVCRRNKKGYPFKSFQICAFWNEGGKDACLGDSGSSMLYKNTDNSRWYFVGIVSMGWHCALRRMPALYSRVDNYYNWIKAKTRFGIGCVG